MNRTNLPPLRLALGQVGSPKDQELREDLWALNPVPGANQSSFSCITDRMHYLPTPSKPGDLSMYSLATQRERNYLYHRSRNPSESPGSHSDSTRQIGSSSKKSSRQESWSGYLPNQLPESSPRSPANYSTPTSNVEDLRALPTTVSNSMTSSSMSQYFDKSPGELHFERNSRNLRSSAPGVSQNFIQSYDTKYNQQTTSQSASIAHSDLNSFIRLPQCSFESRGLEGPSSSMCSSPQAPCALDVSRHQSISGNPRKHSPKNAISRTLANPESARQPMQPKVTESGPRWICDVEGCGKSFTRSFNLTQHKAAIHRDERRFECSYCSATFYRRNDLSRHERSHTGERPYKCECGQSFTRTDLLTRHKHYGNWI
ncbi:expressed protein [Phakopsora pachyrhizi]|uniref:Expressed protein n=1 Tax=Phakopsora pachyrhizi TaxID=170000 RepID=A0AAV0AX48_PHAPC|nr:expressed protein [Phakopsora pachyrhizi]